MDFDLIRFVYNRNSKILDRWSSSPILAGSSVPVPESVHKSQILLVFIRNSGHHADLVDLICTNNMGAARARCYGWLSTTKYNMWQYFKIIVQASLLNCVIVLDLKKKKIDFLYSAIASRCRNG